MRPTSSVLISLLILLEPCSALGQPLVRELRGVIFSIENGEQIRKFFPDVEVTILEFGARSRTNDQGVFRVQFTSPVSPGQEVTLQADKKGYAICSPLFGKQLVPAVPTRMVEIRMLPEGSRLFWTHERIQEFITHTAKELTQN
jgi:hypothetical protein